MSAGFGFVRNQFQPNGIKRTEGEKGKWLTIVKLPSWGVSKAERLHREISHIQYKAEVGMCVMASKVATIVALVGTIKLNVRVCVINEFTISKLNFSRCCERERERALISRLFTTFPWCALGHSLPLTHNIVLTIVIYTHVHNHHCVNYLWREARLTCWALLTQVAIVTWKPLRCDIIVESHIAFLPVWIVIRVRL